MYHPKDGHVSKNMYWEGNVYHLCIRLYIKAPFLPYEAHSSLIPQNSQNILCSFFKLEFNLNQTIHRFLAIG